MFERISVSPTIGGGKPCLKGKRIPVAMELLEDGLSFDEILRGYYPNLTVADVRACIEYARSLVEGEEIYFVEENAGDGGSQQVSPPSLRPSAILPGENSAWL